MAMNLIKVIPLTSINSAAFTGAYQVVNTNGTANACILIRIINDSNVDVTVSYDGATDHDFVPAGTQNVLQFQANAQPTGNAALLAKGTKVYVKGAAGVGLVYLAGYFQPLGG